MWIPDVFRELLLVVFSISLELFEDLLPECLQLFICVYVYMYVSAYTV